jgi:cell division protein FtsL
MTPTATARVRTAPAGPAPGLRARPQSTPRPRRAPAIAPRVPRRVSGPARLRRAAGPALALSELPLLDRLIKGRAWIGLVAFALIGIVTMQLALLKLNAGIGRALVHENALQRENSALSVEASEAQNPDTVELRAGQLGMQFVAPGTLRFLPAQGGETDLARAVAALNADAARAAAALNADAERSASAPTAAGEEATAATAETSEGPPSEASEVTTPAEASTVGEAEADSG